MKIIFYQSKTCKTLNSNSNIYTLLEILVKKGSKYKSAPFMNAYYFSENSILNIVVVNSLSLGVHHMTVH